jgi:hypothetical protein
MSNHNGKDRLQAVITAFERLSDTSPGLSVNGKSNGAKSDGAKFDGAKTNGQLCVIQLRHDSGPEVLLTVETTAANLTATSGDATSHAGTAVITDHLEVNLVTAYRWDDAECADATELAYILYKHMLRRHKAASELEPQRGA